MSTQNFQLWLDRREWSVIIIKIIPTASLFYCGARVGDDTFIFPENKEWRAKAQKSPKSIFPNKFIADSR